LRLKDILIRMYDHDSGSSLVGFEPGGPTDRARVRVRAIHSLTHATHAHEPKMVTCATGGPATRFHPRLRMTHDGKLWEWCVGVRPKKVYKKTLRLISFAHQESRGWSSKPIKTGHYILGW